MLTRALLLNPRQIATAPRLTAPYVGPGRYGVTFANVTWNAALSRLTLVFASQNFLSGTSSGALVAARTSAGKIGIYSIGRNGMATDPSATYPIPATPSGYTATWFHGSGDVAFFKAAASSSSSPTVIITNPALGTTTAAIALTGSTVCNNAGMPYSSGDAFFSDIAPPNSSGVGWSYQVVNGQARLFVSGGGNLSLPLFGRISGNGLSPLSLNIPRQIPNANLVQIVTPGNPGPPPNAFIRSGVCYVPLTLQVDEVDAQDSGDGVTFNVSKATSYYSGLVRLDKSGATFAPFASWVTVRLSVPSKLVAPNTYVANGNASAQWTAANDAYSGSVTPSSQNGNAIVMPGFDAVTGSYGGLYNRQTSLQSGVVATANLGSMSITSQSYPGVTSNLYIVGVPHLDALVLAPPDATGQNAGNISISFDGGQTWKAATTYYQDALSTSGAQKAGIVTYLRQLQPLFVV